MFGRLTYFGSLPHIGLPCDASPLTVLAASAVCQCEGEASRGTLASGRGHRLLRDGASPSPRLAAPASPLKQIAEHISTAACNETVGTREVVCLIIDINQRSTGAAAASATLAVSPPPPATCRPPPGFQHQNLVIVASFGQKSHKDTDLQSFICNL